MVRRLSILAGAGDLVPHAVMAAQMAGYKVQVLALTARDAPAGVKTVRADLTNPIGILWSLKAFRTTHILMAGAIALSDKMREDLLRFAGQGEGQSQNDRISAGDTALSGLAPFLKKITGAELIGIQDLDADLLATTGLLAGPQCQAEFLDMSQNAVLLARKIGEFDAGQALVMAGRRVVAIEDVAGTDALIGRAGKYRADGLVGDGTSPLILAKAMKPSQPFSIDLPSIGPQTVQNAAVAGIKIIAIEAKRTLVIEREKLIAQAHDAGVSVYGITLDP